MTASSASASPPSPVPFAIARSMLSLGIEASLAFWIASDSAGLPSASPPPSFAATVIARASFVKSLPRRASTIAFLCLIPAHLECPAIGVRLVPAPARPGAPGTTPRSGAALPRARRKAARRRRRRLFAHRRRDPAAPARSPDRPQRRPRRPAHTMPAVPVPAEIFKAYDIRGLAGEQIAGDVAGQVGRAFVRVLAGLRGRPARELRIGLGRDMRLSAPELAARYREGMTAEGADVLDAGMVGTEMLYFLVGSRGLDGGLMCTASHNPKAYTGAKLVREGAIALSGDQGIQDIRREIDAGMGDARGGGDAE